MNSEYKTFGVDWARTRGINDFKIGQWIVYPQDGHKIKGFILNKNHNQLYIRKTLVDNKSPYNFTTFTDPELVMDDDYIGIYPDDIGSMIDLALQTRDKEWFDKLIKEYKSWHPASKLETLI